MKKRIFVIIMAVLLISTAIFTIYVFIPSLNDQEVVNTDNITVLKSSNIEQTQYKSIEDGLSLLTSPQSMVKVDFTNRILPENWQGKDIFLKYTYLGEYSDSVYSQLNSLLLGEYSWKKQLGINGEVILGGPMFIKDGVYQLHVHNALSLGKKYFLFGDLLDYFRNNGLLDGTKIVLGNVKIQNIWYKEMEVTKENTIPGGIDLIISTCLERNGDLRLVTGWKVVKE